MIEPRKRPASPENIGPSPKKRIISASDWSKPISVPGQRPKEEDDEDEDEIAADQLERFRKEAIFRRMKHYARLYEDASQRMKAMEAKVHGRDAAVAAVDAVWNQLVYQAQLLIPNGLPSMNESSLEIYNITYALPLENEPEPKISMQYYERLRETSLATQKLIGALVHLSPNAPSPEVHELRAQCAAYRSESATFHAEARMLRSKLRDVTTELQGARETLIATENRVERVRSETLVLLEAKLGRTLVTEPEEKKPDVKMLNGTEAHVNGSSHKEEPQEDGDWKALAESRDAKIVDMGTEIGQLKDEITRLKAELQDPAETSVTHTVHYQKLLGHLTDLKTAAEESKAQANKFSEELIQLKESRTELQNMIQPELEAKLEQTKASLQKLQHDTSRLRGTRDALNTELTSLKSKDLKQTALVNGLKSTNAIQKDRIASLVQETQRLRAALAVETADEDYYAFISNNPDERVSFVTNLKAQLKEAQAKTSALEVTLQGINASQPDVARLIQSESEARKLYVQAQDQLAKYERVYGSGSASVGVASPAGPQKLVELVAEKDEALRAMKSLMRQEEERTHGGPTAMDDLCRQIEDLIALKEKELFDLASLEERVNKSQAEKAKAESKYFAAMRSKDAADGERKAIEAALGKQVKRIEKLQESEQALKQQIHHLEKLCVSTRQELAGNHQHLARLEEDLHMANATNESQSRRVAEFDRELKERHELAESRRQQLRKLEEEHNKLKRELRGAEHRADHIVVAPGTPTEVSKQNDNLLKILKCSTCTKEFRSHVLTKCMHTFCKSCIDARLSTRQRKCPACQMAFAQSDVQTIYFQ